jgi:hypothetical protein
MDLHLLEPADQAHIEYHQLVVALAQPKPQATEAVPQVLNHIVQDRAAEAILPAPAVPPVEVTQVVAAQEAQAEVIQVVVAVEAQAEAVAEVVQEVAVEAREVLVVEDN